MVSSLIAVIAALPRGLDLTDEGSRLHIIAFPTLYFRVSQFGFVFNPIFNVLGRDIVLFRLFGFVSMLLLSLYMFSRILGLLRHEIGPIGTRDFVVLVLIFASSAILFYGSWLPTPNYNTLNMFGCFLVAAGLVPRPNFVLSSNPRPISLLAIDGSLLAIGLAVCFLAKPTTPVVLAPLVLLVVAQADRSVMLAAIVIGGSSAIVIATLFAIDATPNAIIDRYADERAWRHILQSGHDFKSLLTFSTYHLTEEHGLTCMFAIAVSLFFVRVGSRNARHSTFGKRSVAVWFIVLAAGTFGIHFYAIAWNQMLPLTIPIYATVSAGCLLMTCRWTDASINWGMLTSAGVLMVFPFAVGFGSASKLLVSVGPAGVFWVAGTLLLIGALSGASLARDFMMATALVTSIVCSGVVAGSWIRPYRIPTPLWLQTEWISVREHDRAVQVDPATATYFRQLREALAKNGFTDGTPIIDLTGMSPTTVYAVGGSALGAAWLLGAYPGSSEFATLIVARMQRTDLERAWILTAPNGERRIDVSVLTRNGVDFPGSYAEAGRATTGYLNELQILWKPIR